MLELTPDYALQGKDEHARPLKTNQFSLKALNDVRKLRLQIRSNVEIDVERLGELLGITVPVSPQQKAGYRPSMYWLAPNDWLLVHHQLAEKEINSLVKRVLSDVTFTVIDVSDAYSMLEISGADAVSSLSEACSIDFDSRSFGKGSCALTRLQNLAVILHRIDDTPRFQLLMDRCVASFLWEWLESLDYK